jgi:hypothetical protein
MAQMCGDVSAYTPITAATICSFLLLPFSMPPSGGRGSRDHIAFLFPFSSNHKEK